jgi:hypothetical protein
MYVQFAVHTSTYVHIIVELTTATFVTIYVEYSMYIGIFICMTVLMAEYHNSLVFKGLVTEA